MNVRYFHASDLTTWRVWAVHPAGILADRRRGDRRVAAVAALTADPPRVERRAIDDRRRAGARSRGSHVLPSEWQDGWLVFEADIVDPRPASTDLRRLAPIPADWEACPEPALAHYLEQAQVAERRTA